MLEISLVNDSYSREIVELILNIQQKEFNVPITIEDQPDLMQIENFYFASGGSFWGAFSNGELVGTIALIKFDEKKGAIRKMFVKKEFRGKEYGIAQKLLETLIAYCRKNGIDEIYLGTVSILKAALRFYERNHFEIIEKDLLPSKFPLMRADNVFCFLHLKS
ncbi:GNAT family N-acetyltransferase [Chryseobacterium zhengzhouense]|uniref:GNAT family N-acetyltransferase n=1 Tax=Chryseobacterium zhengzhouense TaxID=1636086 RepID=A0ABW2LUE0_9FLAO